MISLVIINLLTFWKIIIPGQSSSLLCTFDLPIEVQRLVWIKLLLHITKFLFLWFDIKEQFTKGDICTIEFIYLCLWIAVTVDLIQTFYCLKENHSTSIILIAVKIWFNNRDSKCVLDKIPLFISLSLCLYHQVLKKESSQGLIRTNGLLPLNTLRIMYCWFGKYTFPKLIKLIVVYKCPIS